MQEDETRAAARKPESKRTDAERAALSADQLSLGVRNELHATERRERIYGRDK